MQFSHLHNHTQFSLLDGACGINDMLTKAKNDNQAAVAITDHGNMFGVFKFVNEARKVGITPIIGCEFYVVEDRFQKKFTKEHRDKRYHQLLLAKNEIGYKNIAKLCSLGYIDGLYSKWPRIDLELLKQYKEGLIATTCCIGAIIPQTIIKKGVEAGEKVFKEYHDIFGDDFYVELQRHGIENLDGSGLSQEDVNQVLIGFSEKYKVPLIATNDSHYVNEEDSNAHDILLCVNTGELQTTPIGKNENYGAKGTRFGFPNSEFYFKTTAQMEALFKDVPQALDNTNIIVDQIETPELKRDVLLPAFEMPPEFKTQDDYLRHLTYVGAKKRYGEITAEIEERLDFELSVIKESGYPGYFLIVQDFTTVARDMKVSVGPGRGSAAGSAVAYCIGITNVDPIKYQLLFERFLNPERVSLPDIDIDFDDEGRGKVIDYVVDKYGKNQVAQIITYGSMAAKSAMKDVGRVMDIPLADVNFTTKSFPDHLSASLNKVLAEGGVQEKLKGKLNADQLKAAEDFRKIAFAKTDIGKMIMDAKKLEGSIRNTGVHACGVIITPTDITDLLPVTVAKDSDLLLTQFDNSVVEDAGLLKMDFLGLKTLTIIKDAIAIIKERHGVEIIADEIPLDDEVTYKMLQKGLTTGVFQFESAGMKKHLINLVPDKFEDLIAMNALYRPGPMEYIPSFIARKHGKEEVKYDLDAMKEFLEETQGITVYQEQVMLLSQKLAGFSKGQADTLRKAMGKKIIAMMDKMYPLFIEGGKERGHDEKILAKVWKDWEAFASYAFNKSHSTCYAFVAFQTAYLKANYPAEYMASVLGHNSKDIKKVSFFMEECRKLKIPVLGPDINESNFKFTVNKDGAIRFAMSAVKGMGGNAVEDIIEERQKNGSFTSIFNLTERVNLRTVNKRSLEAMVISGGFDCWEEYHRAQYFNVDPKDNLTLLEKSVKYGNKIKANADSAQASLFGGTADEAVPIPKVSKCDEWNEIEKLNKEKELIGIYLSGHPLDTYNLEMKSFCNCNVTDISDEGGRKAYKFGGIITATNSRFTKKGTKFCIFTIEDFNGSLEIFLFGKDYLEFGHMVSSVGSMVFIEGQYQAKRYNENEFEFKVTNIMLLEDVLKEKASALQLKMKLEDISEPMIKMLKDTLEKNQGELGANLSVIDVEEKIKLNFWAKQYRTNLSFEMRDELDLIPG
ncbi:MAG: DNA polymerase III subunit alpha, partial [Chitinophagales bacterium]